MAAFSPSWASEITSLMPVRPRPLRLLRKSDQNTSASDGPRCRPTISRLLVDGNGDYRRDRDDPAGRSDLEIGGIEPQVGPFAFEPAGEEAVHSFVDVLAQLADRRFGDPGHAHRLH